MDSLIKTVNPISFKEKDFLDFVRNNTKNVIITKKPNIERFYDFPKEAQHYLFAIDRVAFSLVFSFSEETIRIDLYLGEKPEDYFKPNPKNPLLRKKVFSESAVRQNKPYLLSFYRSNKKPESWSKIQIPHHDKRISEINEAVYQVQRSITLFLENES